MSHEKRVSHMFLTLIHFHVIMGKKICFSFLFYSLFFFLSLFLSCASWYISKCQFHLNPPPLPPPSISGLCDFPSNGAFCHCDENFYGRDCSLKRSPAPVKVGEFTYLKSETIVPTPASWAKASDADAEAAAAAAAGGKADNSSESYSSERDYGIESSDDFLSADDEIPRKKIPFYTSDSSLALLSTLAVICVVVRVFRCMVERSGVAGRMGYTNANRVPTSAMDSIVKMA